MSLIPVLTAAGTGLLAGPWLRGLIFAHSVASGQPPRASCPGCGTAVVWERWRALVAVAPLRGRCPACATRIGPPAGPVELIAAAVLAVLAGCAPSAWVLAAWGWAALLGIALAWIDTAMFRLPDTLTIAATAGVLALLSIAAAATDQPHPLIRALTGAVALGLLYLIAVLAPGGGMGRGDAQLAVVIGACLGWRSLGAVADATRDTILLAAGYVLIMLALRRLRRHDPVAYGVFILLGALLAVATDVVVVGSHG
jgi:leader peptidase (prepilin peptidase)/N-methyltransferase